MASLTLVTWNVRYFAQPLRGLFSTATGVRRAARALAAVAPDLIALQEVEGGSWRSGGRRPQLDRFLDARRTLGSGGRRVDTGTCLNRVPGSAAWRALSEAGWRDAYASVGGPSSSIASFGPIGMHIDHVFSTPSVCWKVCRSMRRDGDFAGLSDHLPKLGTLVL